MSSFKHWVKGESEVFRSSNVKTDSINCDSDISGNPLLKKVGMTSNTNVTLYNNCRMERANVSKYIDRILKVPNKKMPCRFL